MASGGGGGGGGGGGDTPENQIPTASFTVIPATGNVPLNVDFDASASDDPDGTIASYAWVFGDGLTGTGATISHIYASTGAYTITLTVTDNGGATDTHSGSVTVVEMVTTPDVVGMSQANAEAAIGTANLIVGTVSTAISDTVPSGDVISQIPTAGTLVESGSLIDLLVSIGPALPPNPEDVAPLVDPTVSSNLAAATTFLYTGSNPIQTQVASDTIEEKSVAVLRGRVIQTDESGLGGATVTVLGHPDYGQTLSRIDGRFDMAVNGGGTLVVKIEKPGYLSAQRRVSAPWQNYVEVPEVMLIQRDPQLTVVDFNASGMQTAQGSEITDKDGTRQATLLFPEGTIANLVMPDGSTQAVNQLTVSATEYTVGDNGPKAMPAELPAQTGYTYCVELLAAEAEMAGAQSIQFNQPMIQYVENFLGFPVGGAVPVGYYDREKAVWLPSDNGLIIEILSISNGIADLDVDGSHTPADAQALADLEITPEELEKLAELYLPGQSLWRIPLNHFSTWDANWGWGPALDALAPLLDLLGWLLDLFKDDFKPCEVTGSIIECQNQIVGETVGVVGTPFTLNYRSNRVPGRKADYILDIPLSEETVSASLKRIDLEVEIAGQIHKQSFDPLPDQEYVFTWDGKDAYGRTLQGTQPVTIRVGYVYDGYYQEPADLEEAFGYRGNGTPTSVKSREEFIFWQEWESSLGPWDARSQGLGGWTLNAHHAYDPVGRILYPGYGGRRKTNSNGGVIDTVAGEIRNSCPDTCPALELGMDRPYGITLAPDGSVYIADTFNSKVRKVRPDGMAENIAPTDSFSRPQDVALDTLGNLYIADSNNYRIVRVAPNGSVEDFAGTGLQGFSGDGGPAIDAQFDKPVGLAIGPDGSLYVSDVNNNRIRRITPDGIIRTIAGNGIGGFNGDGGAAVDTQLYSPFGIDVGPGGSIVFADTDNIRVRRISPDGIVSTISGGGNQNFKDGLLATDINLGSSPYLNWPIYGPNGIIYHSLGRGDRICKITPDGIISTVAGTGDAGFFGDGGPATAAGLSSPNGIALGHTNNLYIADRDSHRLREVSLPFPLFGHGEITIPSEDGSRLYHFDVDGRHLRTTHALTGTVLYSFSYNGKGLLVGIEDGSGNETRIERDGDDNPTAIVAPFGQRTDMTLDANGYLTAATDPENHTYNAAYSNEGLIETFTDPNNNLSEFTYDTRGRLLKDENAAGGFSELNRIKGENTYTVGLETAEARSTTYQTEALVTNEIRRVNTFPDGTRNESIENPDGSSSITFADGMVVETAQGPDPRFEMLAPITEKQTLYTPDGLVHQSINDRTGVFTDPLDPQSLESLTYTATINGQTYTSSYDAAGRTWTGTTPAGRQTISTLDERGRPLTFQTTDLETFTLAYDSHGRIDAVAFGDRDVDFVYNDVSGFLQSITNPLAETASFTFDAAGRITALTLPDTSVWGYEWDGNGNLTTLTEPNGSTNHVFTYTPTDLFQTYTSPLNTVETFTYNKDDQLVARQFPSGNILEWVYDAQGHLSTVKTPEGDDTFDYDGDTGQLIQSISRDGQQIDYTYDGALRTRADWNGLITGSVVYNYNNDFLISQINYAGTSLSVTHDSDGLLTGVGTITLARDAGNGLVTGVSDGSFSIAYTYNTYGEVETATATQGATLYDVNTTYDDLGRIFQKTESIGGLTQTWEYGYDIVGQLIAVKQDAATVESYGYDAVGNRISISNSLTGVNLGSEDFSHDADSKLLAAGTTTYGYDADGRLHTVTDNSDSHIFSYNSDGTLAQADLPDGRQITYLYDHMGRRIARKDNGVQTHTWLYGDGLLPIVEYDGSGSVIKTFIYATGPVPMAFVQGGSTFHIVSDHLGSPRLVVESDGAIIKQIDYDSFGNVIGDTNTGLYLCFGFAGGMADPDHELVRFGVRDYQPSTGRWTAKDPILFEGGFNLYGYVGNDPANSVDREGMVFTYTHFDEDPFEKELKELKGDLHRLSQNYYRIHAKTSHNINTLKGCGGVSFLIKVGSIRHGLKLMDELSSEARMIKSKILLLQLQIKYNHEICRNNRKLKQNRKHPKMKQMLNEMNEMYELIGHIIESHHGMAMMAVRHLR